MKEEVELGRWCGQGAAGTKGLEAESMVCRHEEGGGEKLEGCLARHVCQ